MKCQELDLKAYLFAELESGERRRVDEHVSACSACREELNRLQLTQASLLMVREEELPRRVAFVSDAVFEPNWWQRFWQSGPRVAFAAAGMLSAAILVHGFTRPVPVIQQAAPVVQAAAISQVQLQAAVEQAVHDSEERHAKVLKAALKQVEKNMALDRKSDQLAVEETLNLMRKEVRQTSKSMYSGNYGGAEK
jgi:anti-sigma factor RsiW